METDGCYANLVFSETVHLSIKQYAVEHFDCSKRCCIILQIETIGKAEQNQHECSCKNTSLRNVVPTICIIRNYQEKD